MATSLTAVDLFAGAGGWTTGATQAGLRVLVAANHWATAVRTHRMNHPETTHLCQDLSLMDPRQLPRHDVLIASPACQGHSNARGTDRPHHDASRATAWCVVDIAEVTTPPAIVVENVPGFRRWPLYGLWLQALQQLGYSTSEATLDAADFGVPQERERLFIVGTRGRPAPVLRAPTNPKRVPVRDIIDWNGGGWSPVDKPGRAPATLRRIAAGRAAFGDGFVAPYYSSGSGETGRSIDRPLGTITTIARWAVIDGDRMRMLTIPENRRAMSFPERYHLWGNQREQLIQLGNAVPPLLARGVLEQIFPASSMEPAGSPRARARPPPAEAAFGLGGIRAGQGRHLRRACAPPFVRRGPPGAARSEACSRQSRARLPPSSVTPPAGASGASTQGVNPR